MNKKEEVKTIRIRIPKEIWKQVSIASIELEVSKERLVNKAIKEWLVRKVKKVEEVKKVVKKKKIGKIGKEGK